MTTILKEMVTESTGCELTKCDDAFYVHVFTESGSRTSKYSDMNEHGLLAAIATYQIELGYFWAEALDDKEG